MTTQTLTLTDFLLARIAEELAQVDEAAAMYPQTADEPHWHADLDEVHVAMGLGRARAECEAKRRIVGLHTCITLPEPCCKTCDDETARDEPAAYPCPTLRAVALPYADHPDYCEEWKP